MDCHKLDIDKHIQTIRSNKKYIARISQLEAALHDTLSFIELVELGTAHNSDIAFLKQKINNLLSKGNHAPSY
jgi:PIN domain nuclease of toxin-antitoxin system